MSKQMWVYVPVNNEQASSDGLSLLAKARGLLDGRAGWELTAVVLAAQAQAAAASVAAYADRVLAVEGAALAAPDHMTYADALAPLLQQRQPELMLFPVNNFCGLLAAVVGARLRTGVIAHATDARLDDEERIVGVIPAFGGQYLGDILCPSRRPQLIGVRASGLTPQPLAQPGSVELLPAPPVKHSFEYKGSACPANGCASIEEAEVIFCGGLGLGSAENWALLQQAAQRYHATLACTRPPIDQGWADSEQMMIGTSGKYVTPRVYVGFGVSGTAHHVCGMKDSGRIFNVNTDDRAASLTLSDYAVVADAGDILRELLGNTTD